MNAPKVILKLPAAILKMFWDWLVDLYKQGPLQKFRLLKNFLLLYYSFWHRPQSITGL